MNPNSRRQQQLRSIGSPLTIEDFSKDMDTCLFILDLGCPWFSVEGKDKREIF